MSASTPSPQTRNYSLQVIRFEGPAAAAKTPNLYAKVRLGNDSSSQQTQRIKGTSPSWNETFTFASSDISARLIIHIKCSALFRTRNPCVGYVAISLEDLLGKCSNGEAKLDLQPSDERLRLPNGNGAIFLRLQCIETSKEQNDADTTGVPAPHTGMATSSKAELSPHPQLPDSIENVRTEIDNAVSAIRQRGIGRSAMGEKFSTIGYLSSQLGEQSDLYKSIWALCNKIGIFADIIDKLAVVHPYLNAAWQVTSSLFRVAEKKFENDQSIVELVCAANEAFDFACEIVELPDKMQSLQRAITGLLAQTTELCIFVRHYTSQGLAGQVFGLSDSSKKIGELKGYFDKFKSEFAAPLALQTAFVSARISEEIKTIYLRQELDPADKAATGRPQCLPGTRGEYLSTIMGWVFSDAKQNILWLYGVAGSGKSTISMTIAEQSLGMSRRGAYLYFERGKSDPNTVIRSIAFWLASFDHSIAKHVSEAVKANNGIAKASLARQFEVLLLQPLLAAAEEMIGPTVVILDALDECGPFDSRRELLKLLAEQFSKLPPNFRFIITSRQEPDILRVLSVSAHVLPLKLDHDSEASRHDVSRYFIHEMDEFFEIPDIKQQVPPNWPLAKNIAFLAGKALGLFIWASTSIKHIKKDEITAFETFDRLITDIRSHGTSNFGLGDLYSTMLRSTQISWDNKEIRLRFQRILYLILEVKVALSTDDIDGILGLSSSNSSTLIISRLQSVLAYTPGSASRIRPLHASFADFLKSPEQTQSPWYIDISTNVEYISKRCYESFDKMDRLLHFNMCEIETSFICNDCIPDLQSRIEQKIPSELNNACVYWVQQLRILPYSLDLLPPLGRFLHYHLLSWLEVLSLMGKVKLANIALVDAIKWVTGHNASFEPFLRDAWKLVIAFSIPISKSMPHIYLSMIPLAWSGSEVAAHYSRATTLPSKVEIIGNRSQRAPPTIFRGHSGLVISVAFSLDGKRVVSGSTDGTVIVWDPESGEVVAGPLKGHTKNVNSVVFSRDGKYVVSGSDDMTVIVWNSESGEIFRGPFVGHTGVVNCASFSPDGKHVVSGSGVGTILVWEVESGKPISATFEGHLGSVYAATYSPDGKYIVSGSSNEKLIVWNAQSGEAIKMLEGHTDSVRSAMFSSDGKRIVSGSADNFISVWDLESGKLIADPFEGHLGSVIFVAFSSDGKYIFSGSRDNTMKVWDAESGEIISSMAGEDVWSVAFSSDGKRGALGSLNGTIRVYDVQVNDDATGSIEGHTGGVLSISYSPNGKHIVSGSNDKTMIVWDVKSGKVAAGPFRGHSDGINCVAYSPDGKYIVSGSDDTTLIVWDVETGEVISGPLIGHADWVTSIAFSPDGKWVVSGSCDKTIIVWEVASDTIILGPLEGHLDAVKAVWYSPDGKYIVSGSADKTIRIWSAESGKTVLAPLEGHAAFVISVAYSPDGKYIASGSDDETVIVWGAESGAMISGPFDKHTHWVRSVQFSPDGKYVVSGSLDKMIIVWDVEIGEAILGPLKGHTDGVMSVQFSPDGRHIASGSLDCTIRIWDVENAAVPSPSSEASTHQKWALSEDGWVQGQEGELLIWIPPDMRTSLCYPRNTAVMNRFVTKLYFTERGMGTNWHECFDPQKLSTAELFG